MVIETFCNYRNLVFRALINLGNLKQGHLVTVQIKGVLLASATAAVCKGVHMIGLLEYFIGFHVMEETNTKMEYLLKYLCRATVLMLVAGILFF